MRAQKICFIISPIGKKGSPEYIHWLKVRKHIIDKVAIEKGYKTIRSDDVSEPGKITTQIIDLLRNSDLVVADLSRENANVFYELAIRDAVRKPVILIGESDLDIPFDVRDLRLLKYSLDLDEIEESKTELAKYIDAIEAPAFQVTSPVTMALMTPADDISASSQEYFKLIFDKISSLSANIARSQAPRALEPVGVDFTTRGIDEDILFPGKPRSLQMQLHKVLNLIEDMERIAGIVKEEDLFRVLLNEFGIRRGEASRLIGILMRDGITYSPKSGYYKKT